MVRDLVKNFPSSASIKAIGEINTDYVILHSSDYKKKSWEQLENRIKGFGNDLKLVQRFDTDYVYELINNDNVIENPKNNKFQKISSDNWVAYSNQSEKDVDFAFDGNLNTRWTTKKPQTTGTFFTLDLGSHYNIQKIIISLKKHIYDYPRDYQIKVSIDGITWEEIRRETDFHFSISSVLRNPKIRDFEIMIYPATFRFLKITLVGHHDTFHWSINELNLIGEIVQP